MEQSKLITLLKTFSKVELNRFSEYVTSPYFNKNQQVRSLMKVLYDTYPKFENTTITKESVYKKIFGKDKFNSQKLRDVMSYLTSLAEEFIMHVGLENDPIARKEVLLKEFRQRGLNKYFPTVLREAKALNERTSFRDYTYYYNNYLLEYEENVFFMKNEKREQTESLQKKADNLDVFYLSAKLKNCCEMANSSNVVLASYNLNMIDEILLYLDKNISRYRTIPVINIYYYILLTLIKSEKENHYFKLKELLLENHKNFDREEMRQMYDCVQNYCIKKINSGHSNYLNELMEVYELLLQHKIIFDAQGLLSQWDYKNIVSTGIRLNKFDWTEKFIHQYKDFLSEEIRQNAFNFNLASFYYSKKDYKNAFKLLQQVEYTDVYYHLSAKSLLLKAYYEQEDTEGFYSLVDTFKIYLKRNKTISAYQYEVHYNLIRFIKKANDLRIKHNNKMNAKFKLEITRLQEEVEKTKQITNINWLREKITELMQLG